MKVNKATWQSFSKRYGDYEARRKLRWATRQHKMIALYDHRHTRKEVLATVWDLIHTWPGGSPAQNRKKFAEIIRVGLQRTREHRLQIDGYRKPGQIWQRLP